MQLPSSVRKYSGRRYPLLLDERSKRQALGSSGRKGSRSARLSLLLLVMVLLLAIPWPGIFYGLQVTLVPSGQVLVVLPFFLRHPFSLSYTHSIYLVPVVEKFEVQGTQIKLREIYANNWGVVEYYNISKAMITEKDQGKIWIEGIDLQLPKITMLIGSIGKQRLIWENRTYSLFSLTGPGEKLKIEAASLSPGKYLWERVKILSFSP